MRNIRVIVLPVKRPMKDGATLTCGPKNVRMKLPKGGCDWLHDAILLLSMHYMNSHFMNLSLGVVFVRVIYHLG